MSSEDTGETLRGEGHEDMEAEMGAGQSQAKDASKHQNLEEAWKGTLRVFGGTEIHAKHHT